MTKDEVLSTMGKPTAIRSPITNKYGQAIEVWEYTLYKKWIGPYSGAKYYWLYFCNGKLVQWEEAGDWRRETGRIYETKFQ
jgi:hypothetical protein